MDPVAIPSCADVANAMGLGVVGTTLLRFGLWAVKRATKSARKHRLHIVAGPSGFEIGVKPVRKPRAPRQKSLPLGAPEADIPL